MELKVASVLIGVLLILAGGVMLAYSYDAIPYQVTLTRTVVDTSGNPLSNAYLKLSCEIPDLGYVPYDGYSSDDGSIVIPYDGVIKFWVCQKAGYEDNSGENVPPTQIVLVGIGEEPPSNGNDVEPPIDIPQDIPYDVLGIILIVAGLILVFVRPL